MQKRQFADGQYQSLKQRLILSAKGFAMGATDIIPGVSGGTIALISGIYEHLITALSTPSPRHIFTLLTLPIWIFNTEKRKQAIGTLSEIPWGFLIFLAIGIAIGILSMSRLIPFLMDQYPFATYSFFFGLIVFSITIPFKMMKHGLIEYFILAVFTLATFWLVTLSPLEHLPVQIELTNSNQTQSIKTTTDANGSFSFESAELPQQISILFTDLNGKVELEQQKIADTATTEKIEYKTISNTTNFDITIRSPKENQGGFLLKAYISKQNIHDRSLTDFAWLWLTGAVAICAMILPGISGAYILVLLGEYRFILESLHNRDIAIVAVFVFGILSGILTFVHAFKFLLKNYHSVTMAALTGFLIGSLGKIWPFLYLQEEVTTTHYGMFAAIAVGGALLLLLLERVSVTLGDVAPPLGDNNSNKSDQ